MINKLKNINYKLFFINILKNFIKNTIKMTIVYKLSMLTLGYCVLTPLLIRIFNFTTVADCAPKEPGVGAGATVNGFFKGLWHGSDALAQQQAVFNGLSTGQLTYSCLLIIGGLYGLHLIGEYAVPPLMRSIGWTSWYTQRELSLQSILNNNTNNNNINEIGQRVINLENQIDTILTNTNTTIRNQIVLGEALDSIKYSLDHSIIERIDHARNIIVGLIGALQNTLSTINNENLNHIRAMQTEMLTLIHTMTGTLHTQSENTLSPIALRAEMERLLTQFNNAHGFVTTELQTVLDNLRGQSDVTQSLGNADERLQANIQRLESLLQQHLEAGNVITETVQNDIVAQLDQSTQQVSQVNNNSIDDVPAGPHIPRVNLPELIAGTGAGAVVHEATRDSSYVPTTSRLMDASDRATTQIVDRTASANLMPGQYTFEHKGDELIIRLQLKGNIPIPVENMATSPIGTEIISHAKKAAGNYITDRITTMLLSGALRVGAGALGGGLTGLGFSTQVTNSILRNISPGAVSDVVIAEEKIDASVQVAKTFGKAALNYMFK